MTSKFRGTGVALVTPFDSNKQVDYKALEKLLINISENGADYIVVHGTTGESATTSKQEKAEILKFIKANNVNKLPLVYGLGGNGTDHIVHSLDNVDFDGVDALLSVSPYYNKPSQEGIIKHYEAVADHSPVPLILYNVPGRTSSNMKGQSTLTLAKHNNIIGVKEASGNIGQCVEIANGRPEGFLLISGDDLLTLPIISIGGDGVISVMANIFPQLFKTIMDYALQGNSISQAQKAVLASYNLSVQLFKEGSPAGIKCALSKLGLCENELRLPITPVTEKLDEEIGKSVKAMESTLKKQNEVV